MSAPAISLANAGVNGVATVASTDEATGVIAQGEYFIVISGGGTGTALNMGAAATAVMPTFNAGVYGPYFIASGVGDGKLHAFAQAAGRVDLVPASAFVG